MRRMKKRGHLLLQANKNKKLNMSIVALQFLKKEVNWNELL